MKTQPGIDPQAEIRKSVDFMKAYLKKYPFLLPAAWGDRLLKYRKETAAGNGAAESIRIGSQRIELMKQYGILKK